MHIDKPPHIAEPPHGENLARITGPQQKAIRIAQKPKLSAT